MKSGLNKKTIGWIITVLLPIIIALIPVTESFTAPLRLFLVITVFVVLIMVFELLPTLVSSILLPALYVVSGLVPTGTAFSAYTNATVWMILGGLIFSNVLDECGLLKRISYGIIKRTGGTYVGAVFGCFIVGVILNIITFCTGWIVACALVVSVCEAMGLKRGKEAAIICFAGAVGSNGSVICLYHPGFVSLLETSLKTFMPDYTMSIFTQTIYLWPYLIWCMISFLILIKLYKIDTKNLKMSKEAMEEKFELPAMSTKEKKAIVYVVILLVYLFSTPFTKLPSSYAFFTIPYLMFLPGIGVDDGTALKRTNLPMIFFIASCMGLGSVGVAVGFGDFIANVAVPILQGKSLLVLCIILLFFGILSKLVMTPLAVLGGLSIPFAQIAISLGISPVAACMLLLFSCELVFMPYQASGNMIMYSYGLMPMKDFVKANTVKNILMIIGFMVVMLPLWKLMGLI